MSGICGALTSEKMTEDDRGAFAAMLDALGHRGKNPPQQASHGEQAIMGCGGSDVPGGERPLVSPCGRYLVALDGRLYNAAQLREDMEKDGFVFRSGQDEEIVACLFLSQGPQCLARLNGAFALAVWDLRDRKLYLARDRFGQKPLYYASSGKMLLFSSEIMSLLRHPSLERRPNFNALFHYFTFMMPPAPLTAFEGVHKLEPASWLEWQPGRAAFFLRYWAVDGERKFTGSDEEALEELDGLMNTVARRYVTDNTGLFLSGGLDSSLFARKAAPLANPLLTFSLDYADSDHQLNGHAAQAAELCGTRHISGVLDVELMEELPQIVARMGEPFADPTLLTSWRLARLAAQHVAAAITTSGTDSMFGGYGRFLIPFLHDTPVLPPEVRKVHTELTKTLPHAYGGKTLLAEMDPCASFYYSRVALFYGHQKENLCSTDLRSAADPQLTIMFMLRAFARSPRATWLDKMQFFELDHLLAGRVLPRIDMATAAHALEIRMPLLDNDMADFAMSLPVGMRVRRMPDRRPGSSGMGYETKWLVKMVGRRYLPHDLVFRRRQANSIPLAGWLRGPLRTLVFDSLMSTECRIREWINQSEARRLVAQHMDGTADNANQLWALLMLELWAKHCLGGE